MTGILPVSNPLAEDYQMIAIKKEIRIGKLLVTDDFFDKGSGSPEKEEMTFFKKVAVVT